MKIQVKNLEANPYRMISKYPIDREKIKALKNSINETSFWDNVLVREAPQNGKYQIAYGHHRLVALRELKIKQVDLPVRKLDDATMIRIMANENLDQWKMNVAVVNETVLVAKKFLDEEIRKCKDWKAVRANAGISPIFQAEPEFRSAKGQGVGQTTLLKFLGGNWKQWMIQGALATIKDALDNVIDREAVEEMDSPKAADKFRAAVKKHKISKKNQRGLARQIKADDVPAKGIEDRVVEFAGKKRKKSLATQPKEPPMLDVKAKELTIELGKLLPQVRKVGGAIDNIQNQNIRSSFLLQVKDMKRISETILQE